MLWREYIDRTYPWQLVGFRTESRNGVVRCKGRLLHDGKPVEVSGQGNGPIAAFVHAISGDGGPKFEVAHYSEHSLGAGEGASAIAYIQVKEAGGRTRLGGRGGHQHRAGLDQGDPQRAEPALSRGDRNRWVNSDGATARRPDVRGEVSGEGPPVERLPRPGDGLPGSGTSSRRASRRAGAPGSGGSREQAAHGGGLHQFAGLVQVIVDQRARSMPNAW